MRPPVEEPHDSSAWRAALKTAQLRVTRPRLAVLDAVQATPHSSADEILVATRESLGSISTQAVYDVLHALTESRLLRRIEPAGSPMRYETRVGDNHHHLVCRVCAAVVDVPCATDRVPCANPDDKRGFELDEAEITFWGTCSECRSAVRSSSSHPVPPVHDSPPESKVSPP